MKNFCRFFKFFSIVWIPALMFVAPVSVEADDSPAPSKIAFLRLQIDSAGFRLVDATIVDGTLKSPRTDLVPVDYSYELAGIDSTVLFKGEFENPLIKRYEYEDPDHPGQINIKVVELPSAELIIRVPVNPAMYRLNIYRNERVSARGSAQPERKLISAILVESIYHEADK